MAELCELHCHIFTRMHMSTHVHVCVSVCACMHTHAFASVLDLRLCEHMSELVFQISSQPLPPSFWGTLSHRSWSSLAGWASYPSSPWHLFVFKPVLGVGVGGCELRSSGLYSKLFIPWAMHQPLEIPFSDIWHWTYNKWASQTTTVSQLLCR